MSRLNFCNLAEQLLVMTEVCSQVKKEIEDGRGLEKPVRDEVRYRRKDLESGLSLDPTRIFVGTTQRKWAKCKLFTVGMQRRLVLAC